MSSSVDDRSVRESARRGRARAWRRATSRRGRAAEAGLPATYESSHDPEEARASHVDGILCIRIPKKARSVPTRLAVNAPKPKRAAAAAPDDRDPSKNEADAMCKELLREIHPDMGSERSYTADEVAAMLNAVREATAEDVARQPKKGGKKAKAKKEAEW